MAQERRKLDRALGVLCALALLVLSFAHLPGFAAPSASGRTAEYMLPDGSFASLCLTHHDTEEPLAALACELCCLTSATYLPLPDGTTLAHGHASLANAPALVAAIAGGTAIARPRSRSPPASV